MEPGGQRTLPRNDSGNFAAGVASWSGAAAGAGGHARRGFSETGVLAAVDGCGGARGRNACAVEYFSAYLLYLSALWVFRIFCVSSTESSHGGVDQFYFSANVS